MRIHRSANPPGPDRAALRSEFWDAPDDAWLDRKTVAAGLGMSISWLEKLATQGNGPPYRKMGKRRVLYRKRDVVAWFENYASRWLNSSARLQ
jgi:predicted DNA-binding transcriptional regulator AlpA